MQCVLALGRDAESEGNDLSNVSVGTVNLDGDTEGLSQETHGLETLLVVGTATTDVDADIVSNEGSLVLLQCTNDTLEGSSDVGEVGDTTTNDENLSVSMGSTTGDKVDCKSNRISAQARDW